MIIIKLLRSDSEGKVRLTQYHDQYRWYEGADLREAIADFRKRTGGMGFTIIS